MSGWTEETAATLARLCEGKMPFSRIAEEMYRIHGMKVSRGACIGRAYRMGLAKPRAPRPPKAPKPGRLIKTGKNSWAFGKAPRALKPAPPPKAIPVPTREHACTLLDLSDTNCRWPIWSDDAPRAEQFFCGVPTADVSGSRPYCAYHANVAHEARRGSLNITEAERMRRRKQGRAFLGGTGLDTLRMMQAAE